MKLLILTSNPGMNLFYHPQIEGAFFTLDELESKHAIRVLRLVKGDSVVLVDGAGGWYEAIIEEDHPKRCKLKIQSHIPDYKPLAYDLHMAVSPTKNMERFEWFLEKATEIGVTEITPLLCRRTERKQVKSERMERILISAMKQSLRAYKPTLNKATSLEDFLKVRHSGTLGIAHCMEADRKGINELPLAGNYILMVGPEGDFTMDEIKKATGAGFAPFHLGESRLRTETAAVYITTAVSLFSAS
jgi:16S rRNA (uracil1498-N3)-methyltransferase